MTRNFYCKRFPFVFALALISPSLAAFASDLPRNFETGRITARGGTYVAMPESDQSARFNPATLAASPHRFQFRPFELNLSVSRNLVDTFSELMGDGVADDDDSGPFLDIIDSLDNKFGKRHLGRLDLMIAATRVGWVEVMPFVTSINYLEARQPSIPELYLNTDNRAGLVVAAGYSLMEQFELGVAVKPTHRWHIHGDMAITDILDLSEGAEFSDYAETTYGFGVGVDLSAVWKPRENIRFALLIENVGDMGYLGDGDDKPRPMQQKVSTGFWFRHGMDAGWNLDVSGDWQDMVNRNGYNLLRQTHLGVELGRAIFTNDHDVGFLAGLGQGYPSFGFFMDFWFARVELSRYTQELGSLPGQRPDERFQLTLRSSMSF